jgi:hypothetical protein
MKRLMKSLLDKSFVYTDAAESSKPGYLARKFAAIRREQERAKQRAAEPQKVTAITKRAKA